MHCQTGKRIVIEPRKALATHVARARTDLCRGNLDSVEAHLACALSIANRLDDGAAKARVMKLWNRMRTAIACNHDDNEE